MSLLHIENLTIEFPTHKGYVRVVDKVSLRMQTGEVLGVVGESGSGKSMMALAVMGLLAPSAKLTADYLSLNNQDLMKLNSEQRRKYIARNASIIFQEPENSLNPCFSVGDQLRESLKLNGVRRYRDQQQQAIKLLTDVGISDPETRLSQYPHQLSAAGDFSLPGGSWRYSPRSDTTRYRKRFHRETGAMPGTP